MTIQSPRPSDAAFGEIEFAADVVSTEEVDRVEFLINGTVVGGREAGRPTMSGSMWARRISTVSLLFAPSVPGGPPATGSTSTRRLEFIDEYDVALRTDFRDRGAAARTSHGVELRREDFKIYDNRTLDRSW